MDAVLHTPNEVIEALGGTKAASEVLGKKHPRVCMWLARGRIPSELFFPVNDALQARGKKAAPEVFGMAVPDDTEAAS